MIWTMKTLTESMNLQRNKGLQKASVILLALWISGCGASKNTSTTTPNPADYTSKLSQQQVNATLWYGESLENHYLYLNLYDHATSIIREKVGLDRKRQSAVVLDLDETVLNNVPYQYERISKGLGFTSESWDNWVRREAAEALPGSLEFTQLCKKLGIEVFYISNRSEETLPATLENLSKLGFPNAEPDFVMLKTNTSNKDLRRRKVSSRYDILVFLGDQLTDFSSLFEDLEQPVSKEKLTSLYPEMSRQFILFPNPMYGEWEKHLLGPEQKSDEEKLLQKQSLFRGK